jgi:hypothetical protein
VILPSWKAAQSLLILWSQVKLHVHVCRETARYFEGEERRGEVPVAAL